tara:strand:- start:7 stop:939 length:933 start_codon:yes stop_codon:yes gene_type:complete
MSSQAIRNKITTSIRRVITEVKKKALSEGKKKLIELKDELLTPEQIIRMLSADINQDSCNDAGRYKMEERAKELKDQLHQVKIIADKGLDVIVGLEEKIGAISSKAEIPNLPNPIEEIQKITEAIKPIIEILNIVIIAAPAILAANISAPVTGGPVNGLAITQTNNNVNLAKAKIAEFTNLFQALPRVLNHYISMADKVFDNITKLKNQIKVIVDEITKLLLFIDYMELDFENKCNNLQSLENPPILDPPITITPIPLTLEDIIAEIQELYGDLLEKLIAQGNYKAIRRVYKLGENFQRTINTKVEKIDI